MAEPKEKAPETQGGEEQETRQLTPEEYKEMRAKNKKHMEEEIEYLEVEKKYENLVADVEEAKTRAITMVAQRARFFQKPENPEGEEQPPSDQGPDGPPQPPRKLKKD
jgi:pantothenate kinase